MENIRGLALAACVAPAYVHGLHTTALEEPGRPGYNEVVGSPTVLHVQFTHMDRVHRSCDYGSSAWAVAGSVGQREAGGE